MALRRRVLAGGCGLVQNGGAAFPRLQAAWLSCSSPGDQGQAETSTAAESDNRAAAACSEPRPSFDSRAKNEVLNAAERGDVAAGAGAAAEAPPAVTGSSDCVSEASTSASAWLVAQVQEVAVGGPPSSTGLVDGGAQLLDWVHGYSGLPWWAVIPMTSWTLRAALLPLSLRQAAIVRSNYQIYREAVAAVDRRAAAAAATPPPPSSSGSSSSSSADQQVPASAQKLQANSHGAEEEEEGAAAAAADRLRRAHSILKEFGDLRRQVGSPHPAWVFVNPLVQLPVFAGATLVLRHMCAAGWPGLSEEGALWFPDLTQAAAVLQRDLVTSTAAVDFPLGLPGFALPAAVLAMTVTSIRIGFRAAAAPAGAQPDALSQRQPISSRDGGSSLVGHLRRVLPPLLYAAAVLNTYFTVQMPHGALLHWVASSTFTLSLQLALQRPAVRAALLAGGRSWRQSAAPDVQYTQPPEPHTPQLSGSEVTSQGGVSPAAGQTAACRTAQHPLAAAAAATAAARAASPAAPLSAAVAPSGSVSPQLAAKVASLVNPDALVILAAQRSAQLQYDEASFCLAKALQLDPRNVRAHYSRGQVASLTRRWGDADASFARAAELATDDAQRGQALYCRGTAQQSCGRLHDALGSYSAAARLWAGQPVVWHAIAQAHRALGEKGPALDAVRQGLQLVEANPHYAAFSEALLRLQSDIVGDDDARGPVS